jgi:putative DNA primase/helicase
MDFVSFARLHGVMLDYLPPIGEWKAYPTEDKPKKRNGRVKFMGDHGFVQNWATMLTCEMWQPDDRLARPADPVALARAQAEIAAAHRKAIEDRAAKQELAAKNAARILRGSQLSVHPYLAMKGFPEERGNVYARPNKDDPERVDKLLVVPMRIDGHLVGCQMIDEAGGKKFLTGQRTTDAVFVMDNHGRAILTEGYATALSVRTALTQLRMRFKLIVCFSAGNLARVPSATMP